MRHSGTHLAQIQIELDDDRLIINVRDPGPRADAWVPGVGMSSMRERAAQIGGTLDVTRDDDGALVRALLRVS